MKVRRGQLRHLLTGAVVFSTGGGGLLASGLELIADIDELEILDVNSVHLSQTCATAYLDESNSVPPLSELKTKNDNGKIEKVSNLVVCAFDGLCKSIKGLFILLFP